MNENLNQVYIFNSNSHFTIKKNSESLFNSPFTLEEREQIISLFKEKNHSDLFNGKSMRLDQIKNEGNKTVIELSMIEFYDFISTTMMYHQRNRLIEYCRKNKKDKELELVERLCSSVENTDEEKSFENVINKNVLSNILAVSILVEDSNGELGLIKRSNKVAVSSGIFSVTCTGSLDEQDIFADNPFISCAKRELEEELNILTDDIDFKGLVMSKSKMQPVILLGVKLPNTWKDLINQIKSAKDFNNEIQEFYSIPVSIVPHFLHREVFTDAAKYQLYSKITDINIHIEDTYLKAFDKQDYLI